MIFDEWFDHAFGVVGAVVPVGQEIMAAGRLLDLKPDAFMDGVDIVLGEQTSGHSALIRHDDKRVTGGIEPLQRFDGPIEQDHAGGVTEMVAVVDDRVVAIEEDGWLHAHAPSPKQVRTALAASING